MTTGSFIALLSWATVGRRVDAGRVEAAMRLALAVKRRTATERIATFIIRIGGVCLNSPSWLELRRNYADNRPSLPSPIALSWSAIVITATK